MNDTLFLNIISVAGVIATIISSTIAVIQYQRHKATQEDYQKLKQIKNTQIWSNIILTLEAYDTLDEAKKSLFLQEGKTKCVADPEIALKVTSARKSVVGLYIKLLEQAVLDEDVFTEETAKEWFDKGLLENEWRYKAALKLAQNKCKNNIK